MTMLQPGDRVGRYEIHSVIGEGGFGKVYLAWDSGLGRWAAIKELSSERRASDPARYAEYLERFKLERRVQGQFQHPHIVSVHDLVQQDGDEYLVEEFVKGGTLRALIQKENHLSPERVVQIGLEMCQAIAAAWEQDVVHRDIKPSNILLTEDGHAKLTDFGVAQIGQMSQRTQSDSHHPGTPAYMSPEQEKGYGYLDERSDLYALALVLYEALTGKSFKRERTPVCQLTPKVPEELEKVVMRALEPDPADRYQCAAEFEAALRHALDRSRPVWLWWIGGAIALLALIVGGLPFVRPLWEQGLPTATATLTATSPSPQTLASLTPTSTPTKAPPVATTCTPAATLSTLTVTVSPQSTRTPVFSAPQLISPPGAWTTKSSRLTFQWEGELPESGYGFCVSLRHRDNSSEYTSPILDGTQWTVDLPGNARDAVGEWRWSVAIVQRDETEDVAIRSDEWTFYYDPFGGPSPSTSPLPGSTVSPLPTPAP
jgi:serine/threonine protein kinase